MTTEEEKICNVAQIFVKDRSNIDAIIDKFAGDKQFEPDKLPISLFMAGSPGAGKTEFSKRLIKYLEDGERKKVVRIDPDGIRSMLPGYSGSNSYLFQRSCSLVVDKIHDYILRKGKNFILDGTLSNYERSDENIRRSLERKRFVFIVYIYQDPLIAWDFTKARENKEGRFIPKNAFIEQFFASKRNANKLKEIYGNRIQLWFIEKNFQMNDIRFKVNIDNIDNYLEVNYTKEQLEKSLKI